MPLPDSLIPVDASLVPPPSAAPLATDQELNNWNVYYQLLLAGKLNRYAGQFIVVHNGKVVGCNTDPDILRATIAQQFGIAEERLVVPFVDDKECISAE